MRTISADYPGLRAAAEQLLDQVQSLAGLPGAQTVDELRQTLRRPSVIAVTGRVNTGKSTLVNSLISAKMAPTSAQETTALLSCYAYGTPTRAEATLQSGQVVPILLTGRGPVTGNVPPESIRHLRVFLQAAVLENCTIVDTPGLGSAATKNSTRTEEAILQGSDPALNPDVLLFLIRDALRPDDEEFLARFSKRRGTSSTPGSIPMIGLIAHADNFGAGPWHTTDPIEEAGTAAAELASRRTELTGVLPISGLLAESVRTGALREQDVRTLRTLKNTDETLLRFAEQLGPPAGVPVENFRRLADLIGAYGIRFGRDYCGSAAQLMQWLYERSGLARLERVLQAEVTGPIECARVEEVLSGLRSAGRAHAWRPEARALIESARHMPGFHRLQEGAALEQLRASAPLHKLVAVLEDLTASDSGLPGTASTVLDGKNYLELASQYQSMVGTASTGVEAQAARVIARSMLIRSDALRTKP